MESRDEWINPILEAFRDRRYAELERLANALVVRFPEDGFGWKALGTALHAQGKDAIHAMERAVRLRPDDAGACVNLGIALLDRGEIERAVTVFLNAISLGPEAAEAHLNLGIAYRRQGSVDQSEASYKVALRIRPNYAEALHNLGNLYKDQMRWDEAITKYREALAQKPDFAETTLSLASSLLEAGQIDNALSTLKGLKHPEHHAVDVLFGIGLCHLRKGDIAKAVEEFLAARRLAADRNDIASSYLFALSLSDAVSPEEVFQAHREWGSRLENALTIAPVGAITASPDRLLRVGFVSADLRAHAVANYLMPVARNFPAARDIEFVAYYNHHVADTTTHAFQACFSLWREVANFSDEALLEMIRRDRIDILFDLSGHTARNRLPVFARKAAPIQISWIGYPGTTGLTRMDFVIADPHFLPAGAFDAQFTERILYLPASACFEPDPSAPAVNGLPALETGIFTFGSFNRPLKLTDDTLQLWSALMNRAPGSRLLLGGMTGRESEQRLADRFVSFGIDTARLTFRKNTSMRDYLSYYHEVDLCLDPIPYCGGTTTCHGLWMGVPTLTLVGQTPAQRSGAAILGHANLGDCVTTSKESYVETAVGWTQRLEELSVLRQQVREKFARSAMCDPSSHAMALFELLRTLARSAKSN